MQSNLVAQGSLFDRRDHGSRPIGSKGRGHQLNWQCRGLACRLCRAGRTALYRRNACRIGRPDADADPQIRARVVPFQNKADRWAFLAEGVERFGWFATSPYRHPVVGSHPIGIEGYKTIAFEIVEQMGGKPPDWCALPVCYGDALAGIWLGFHEMLERGAIDRMPKLLAAEVHGSLERAIAQQTDRIPDMPTAFDALAVSIGATRSTFQALKALRQTKGAALAISNAGLVALQEKVAATEGLFLELSSTIPIAAIREARQRNIIGRDETVVAVVTASGLKDIDRSASPDTASPFGDVESALAVFANGGLH